MIITVASLKGGQAKTTSAVHLAALLGADAQTLLVDGDPNRSALNWHKRKGFPFEVCDERQPSKFTAKTGASPDPVAARADGRHNAPLKISPHIIRQIFFINFMCFLPPERRSLTGFGRPHGHLCCDLVS